MHEVDGSWAAHFPVDIPSQEGCDAAIAVTIVATGQIAPVPHH
jgi:hypothetical protein